MKEMIVRELSGIKAEMEMMKRLFDEKDLDETSFSDSWSAIMDSVKRIQGEVQLTFGDLEIGDVFTLPNRTNISDGFSNPLGLTTWYVKHSNQSGRHCGDNYLIDSDEAVVLNQ